MVRITLSSKCIPYTQPVFSKRLNDRVVDYSAEAKREGIKECSDESALMDAVASGELFRVSSSKGLIIEKFTHSYPYLTTESKLLLVEIGKRFRQKTKGMGLVKARFFVTSMTRTTETMKDLISNNLNASLNSPHLYGNTFDISYARFSILKLHKTDCDIKYLKEALAEVIWQLNKEGRCWATYERTQSCFHIVSRQSGS